MPEKECVIVGCEEVRIGPDVPRCTRHEAEYQAIRTRSRASAAMTRSARPICDCEGHSHVKDAYFERNCAYCGCRKGTGTEPSIYQVELEAESLRSESDAQDVVDP